MNWKEFWVKRNNFIEEIIEKYKKGIGYKRLLEGISFETVGRALEVGSGKGFISSILKDNGWKVFTLDNITDCDVKGDVFSLPFKDKSFDLVFSCGLIEHFNKEQIKRILMEKNRVGNKTIVWFPIGNIWRLRHIGIPYFCFSLEEIKSIFEELNMVTSESIIKFLFLKYGLIHSQ